MSGFTIVLYDGVSDERKVPPDKPVAFSGERKGPPGKLVALATSVRYHWTSRWHLATSVLKSGCFIGYIPVRRLNGDQTYLVGGLFAHNLVRELELRARMQMRKRTLKRASLWLFEKVDTIRKTIIQRAGRLTKPSGLLTLTISAGPQLKERLLRYLDRLSNRT